MNEGDRDTLAKAIALALPRPEYPGFGKPCNGCGVCCILEQCAVSKALLGEHSVCPALMRSEEAWGCGLMIDPLTHAPASLDHIPANIRRFLPLEAEWAQYMALPEESRRIVIGGIFEFVLGCGSGCDTTAEGAELPEAALDEVRQVVAEAALELLLASGEA